MFPYGAIIASMNMMQKNNEKQKKKEAEQKNNNVKDVIVVYENGDCKTIKHGFAVEVEKEGCTLDYKNCTDAQFLEILGSLIALAKENKLVN